MRGEALNCLAQGHRILHPSSGRRPNVALADVEVDARLLPRALYRYLPCLNYDEGDTLRVLGVVSLRALPDDAELFLDYWDVFVWRAAAVPAWMSLTPPDERWFLAKRRCAEALAPIHYAAKHAYAPQLILSRRDLGRIAEQGLAELLPAHLRPARLAPAGAVSLNSSSSDCA